MKNILLLFILIFTVGCGFFNKKDLNDETLLGSDVVVDYTQTSGKFDLSNYFFPKENQINQYKITTIGDDVNTDKEVILTEHSQVEYVHMDLNQININNIAYFIEKTKITKKEFILNAYSFEDYRRFLDINDNYYTYERVSLNDSYRQVGSKVCKVFEHNNSITVLDKKYSDVLTLECIGDFGESTIAEDFEKYVKFKVHRLYAKDVGLIKLISRRCEDQTYGQNKYSFCTDTTKEITEVLK